MIPVVFAATFTAALTRAFMAGSRPARAAWSLLSLHALSLGVMVTHGKLRVGVWIAVTIATLFVFGAYRASRAPVRRASIRADDRVDFLVMGGAAMIADLFAVLLSCPRDVLGVMLAVGLIAGKFWGAMNRVDDPPPVAAAPSTVRR